MPISWVIPLFLRRPFLVGPFPPAAPPLPQCSWDLESPPVALADLLRVHEWTYVRRIQQARGAHLADAPLVPFLAETPPQHQVCAALPEHPSATGHLDGDTAVSRQTYLASLMAAGAVTHAVDHVMQGKARNAFCAVRPPGHHAGPVGVVTSQKDPHGSHGFCLFNNVAIGAAYALHVYRNQGVKRVAILDFDVHHGECAPLILPWGCPPNLPPLDRQRHPGLRRLGGAPVPEVQLQDAGQRGAPDVPGLAALARHYRPREHLLRLVPGIRAQGKRGFASGEASGTRPDGCGPRPQAPGSEAFVYPASGATCDTRPAGTAAGSPTATPAADPNPDQVEEDPNREFEYHGGEVPDPAGPR